ncbi:hypothetical protein BaRGS_00022766 [Batillaria attramentaria]|uniref:Uncharacterized protein n=1 Tax=Batillaria attramentaria TaxID=370345 RepID=A0ABD0KG47_9CAEN
MLLFVRRVSDKRLVCQKGRKPKTGSSTDDAAHDYKKLLFNATFCLVPRGRRLGSFRFLEALQAACVPVLLSNGWELPFSEVIDWKRVAVWGDERLLLQIVGAIHVMRDQRAQTAHPNKQQEKPATPVVGRQASGSGCFGRPWRRKGQEATVGAELEWDHEPQIPSIVRAVTQPEVLAMRQQTQFLWEAYFASVDKIIAASLELVRDRIYRYLSRPLHLWNMGPGAPYMMLEFSDALLDFPFFYRQLGAAPVDKFTAVIYATSPVISSSPLFRLLRNVAKSPYVHKIIVLWHCEIPPPPSRRWPADLGVPVLVKTRNIKSVNARFAPYKEIETDAVFGLDEDALLTTEEIDFAFSVWKEFPDRIVGYPARSHYWDELRGKWRYSSKWANEYSMVLTGAAVYHRYYNYMYTHYASTMLTQRVDASSNCHDILLNFLVSHVTRRPPVKLTQRKQYRESALTNSVAPGGGAAPNGNKLSAWSEQQHFAQRQTCMEEFVSLFGYMPLLRAKSRMDPLLFKDPVSNLRKKYRKIELVQN